MIIRIKQNRKKCRGEAAGRQGRGPPGVEGLPHVQAGDEAAHEGGGAPAHLGAVPRGLVMISICYGTCVLLL